MHAVFVFLFFVDLLRQASECIVALFCFNFLLSFLMHAYIILFVQCRYPRAGLCVGHPSRENKQNFLSARSCRWRGDPLRCISPRMDALYLVSTLFCFYSVVTCAQDLVQDTLLAKKILPTYQEL